MRRYAVEKFISKAMASITEIREFLITVLQPSLPMWALVIIGWKVFPESRTERMQPNTKSSVSNYDEFDDLVPLGPMATKEKLKAKKRRVTKESINS